MKIAGPLFDPLGLCVSIVIITIVLRTVTSEKIPSIPLPQDWSSSISPSAPHHHREGASTRLDTSAELVLGTFAQEQENAWFYETYYPIVLKLPIPDWSPDAHRLNRSAPRCDNDDLSPNFLCPSQQHLDNLLIRTSHSTRFFKNIYTASLFSTEKDDQIYDDNPSCTKIKPHFYHFSTTLKGMDPYLEELRQRCPLAKELEMIEKTLSSSDMNQGNVRHAYERFTHQHSLNKPNLDSKGPGSTNETVSDYFNKKKEKIEWEFAQIVGYTTFQNTFTLFTYADSVRWSNAYATCQSNRLDINLIPPKTLLNILDEASRNITRMGLGYNISIPFDSLLTHFYKLPLTDCVLAMEGMTDAYLIVRLLVPVTRYFKHYKLMKLNKVPFFIRNSRLDNQREAGSICEIKNYKYEEMFLVEYDTSMRGNTMPLITSVMKAPSSCGPYHVCRIPETVHRSLVSPCVEGIISKDEDVTKDQCGFKCYPVSKRQIMDEFPFVIQLTSNRYAIIGVMTNETKGTELSIKCFGKTRVGGLKQEQSDEATIVTLPCACHISVGEVTYFPEYPCNSTLQIIHVTHVVGDGYDGFKFFEGGAKSKNIQDAMNGSKGNAKNQTRLPGEKAMKKVLPEEEDKEEEVKDAKEVKEVKEDYLLEEETMFSIPFVDNRNLGSGAKNGTPPEDLLVIIDASGVDGYLCTHAIVWVLGCIILISDIAMLYALYDQGFVSLDGLLFI